MSRRRSALCALLAALCLGGAGCREAPRAAARVTDDAAATPATESATAVAAPASAARPAPDATTGATADLDDGYLGGPPRSVRAIGHTSVVFKLELPSGKKAAWKPASRRGPVRYKGEIAAYRLARALGLPNVPPAFARPFPAAAFSAARGGDELLAKDGVVNGALLPWIDDLSFLALETAPLSGRWKQWLRRGEAIPDDQRELARQLSTLVAFDFVTGNWDRWSGGNVGLDKATGTVLYIDNDGAFFEVPPRDGLARNRALLQGVDKLSRSFMTRLRALDEDALRRAIGEEAAGVPLLSPRALAGVSERQRELLSIVDTKVADGGADAVLSLP